MKTMTQESMRTDAMRLTATALACAVLLPAAGPGWAAGTGAPELRVQRTVTIAAPAPAVWDVVKDFSALPKWLPAVASDEIVSGTNDTPGAVRLLTLKSGGTIKEKLLEYDDKGHRFRYAILDGVLPVSHYRSTLVVTSLANDRTLVTWSGRFKRKDLSDSPADAENDKAATDAVSGVYQSGLDSLKKSVAAHKS